MSDTYDFASHIQRMAVSSGIENAVDQRDVTAYSYQTAAEFDFDKLRNGLDRAWLSPSVRFGVMKRSVGASRSDMRAVLGLQGSASVRAYDFDSRRPLYFSWTDAVIETMALRIGADSNGLVRLTTFGGGPRVTPTLVRNFVEEFLNIPASDVQQLRFDLDYIKKLCFGRFMQQLKMFEFSETTRTEYRSIDSGRFKSRRVLEPRAERVEEIVADAPTKIEAFASSIEIHPSELAKPATVRFELRGLKGALHLNFPRLTYEVQYDSVDDQADAFFSVVEATARNIVDDDGYSTQPLTVRQIELAPELPDLADTAPYKEVLRRSQSRQGIFDCLDLRAARQTWVPYLRAAEELLGDEDGPELAPYIDSFVERQPAQAEALVSYALDKGLRRLGSITVAALRRNLQRLAPDLRRPIEDALLSSALKQNETAWDVSLATDQIRVGGLTRKVDDFDLEVLPQVLAKLIAVQDQRIRSSEDIGPELEKLNWCVSAASALPHNHWKSPAEVRLISAKRVPRTPEDALSVLKDPVADLAALDDAVLQQFGLPLWPCFKAARQDGGVRLENTGLGSALQLRVGESPTAADLLSGDSIFIPLGTEQLGLSFQKYGSTFRQQVAVSGASVYAPSPSTPRAAISRKRLHEQRERRKQIDPNDSVAGSSPALLNVFEEIEHANKLPGTAPILLTGAPGVGKTLIAGLVHQSSRRSNRLFVVLNAGGAGGDLNIQRGEWLGYGPDHGIAGIDKKGRPGHLMKASGGTLFVDEFVAFSMELQTIFLSVLEGQPVQMVGGRSFTPDVRCIFATNADVTDAVAKGHLRQDLLDRIQARVSIPPLSERRADVVALARRFAGSETRFDDRVLLALLEYPWRGNVRELQHAVGRALVRRGDEATSAVTLDHLDLAESTIAPVKRLTESAARARLWALADQLARVEGFEPGTGLQKRAGDILGVGEAQASKMYGALGLAGAA